MATNETIQVFEVDQPFCSLVYGDAPCTAKLGGTGTKKCYNTLATCQSTASYAPAMLTLRTVRQEDRAAIVYGPAVPLLKEVRTTPARLNICGLDASGTPLGQREALTVTMFDKQHADFFLDKYRVERSFVPGPKLLGTPTGVAPKARGRRAQLDAYAMAEAESIGYDDQTLHPVARGTFWTKWKARNPYYAAMACRVREGALADLAPKNVVVHSGTSSGVNGADKRTLILAASASAVDDAYTGMLLRLADGRQARVLDYVGSTKVATAVWPAQYLSLPGLAVHSAVAQKDNAATINTLEIILDVAMDNWSPASYQAFLCKWNSGFAQDRGFVFYMENSVNPGRIAFGTSADGINAGAFLLSSVATGAANGSRLALRMVWTRDIGGSTQQCIFYTSPDRQVWTQLGSTQTAVTNAIFNTVAKQLQIGNEYADIYPLAGKVYYASLKINGVVFAEFDPSRASIGDGRVVGGAGEVWTMTGAATVFAPSPSGPYDVYDDTPDLSAALAGLRLRNYVVDGFSGPEEDGTVSFTAKDQFTKVEARKALAPKASRGSLSAAITGTPATFAIVPSGIGNADYASITTVTQGHVAIGREIIKVTRNGDTFTVVARAQLSTVQEDHDSEDVVQLVKQFVALAVQDVAYDLIVNYTDLGAASVDKPTWDAAAAGIAQLFTAYVAKPTPVTDLLGELMVQAGFTLVPNVATGKIDLIFLQAGSTTPTVDDDGWIIDESLKLKSRDDKRVSQVWVYYGLRNPLEATDDPKNFYSRVVVLGTNNYGSESVRQIYSRFLPKFSQQWATRVGELVYGMFKDPPVDVEFSLHADRSGALSEARYFTLSTGELTDDQGDPAPTAMIVTSLRRGEDRVDVMASTVKFVAFSAAAGGDSTRRIYVNVNDFNLNMRAIHDAQYAALVGGESVEFIIGAGVTVGSTSVSLPAMETGSWPASVALKLTINGRIQGKGGDGAEGPYDPATTGGDALKVDAALSVDNTLGKIWAGGGGGGGGSGWIYGLDNITGGGGGGGGAGTQVGPGGRGLTGTGKPGQDGAPGTADARGIGGLAYPDGNATNGGDGGDPGQPGVAAATNAQSPPGGGAAGNAGRYVVGNSNVSWIATGDRRGAVA